MHAGLCPINADCGYQRDASCLTMGKCPSHNSCAGIRNAPDGAMVPSNGIRGNSSGLVAWGLIFKKALTARGNLTVKARLAVVLGRQVVIESAEVTFHPACGPKHEIPWQREDPSAGVGPARDGWRGRLSWSTLSSGKRKRLFLQGQAAEMFWCARGLNLISLPGGRGKRQTRRRERAPGPGRVVHDRFLAPDIAQQVGAARHSKLRCGWRRIRWHGLPARNGERPGWPCHDILAAPPARQCLGISP